MVYEEIEQNIKRATKNFILELQRKSLKSKRKFKILNAVEFNINKMHKAFFEQLHKQWKHAKFNFNKGYITLIKYGAFNRIMWLSSVSVNHQ